MTLVLGCLTENFVVQVADRRMTDANTGKILYDDQNKGTQYETTMSFAYSGLGRLNGSPTDLWLANLLSGAGELGDKLQQIKMSAAAAVANVRLPRAKRALAFVGVGFVESPSYPGVRPVQVTISNALDSEARWIAPRDEFTTIGHIMPQGMPFALCHPIGASLKGRIKIDLKRKLRRCVTHDTGPFPIAQHLACAIRKVAASDQRVGEDVVAMISPRRVANTGAALYGALLEPEMTRNLQMPAWFFLSKFGHTRPSNGPNWATASGTFFNTQVIIGDGHAR
jgi:hypothetical protein